LPARDVAIGSRRAAIPAAREPVETMDQQPCTCGARADARRTTRRDEYGRDEIVYRVVCPVCGQLGPAIPAAGKAEAAAIAEAVAAWNALVGRDRTPAKAFWRISV
jgi:hypothetical protein